LAIRKEYHEALLRHNVDLDSIVQGIKEVSQTNESAAIRLKAYQTLLKSLGLDEYREKDGEGGKGWEDIVMKSIDKEETKKLKAIEVDEYEVIKPVVPEEAKQKQKEDREAGEQLYEE
jgi:type II secretory pathway component PulK